MSSDLMEALDELGAGAAGSGAERPAPAAPARAVRELSRKAQHKIARRRGSSIRGYIGPNGSGKTALMVMDTLPTILGQRWKCDNPDHRHTAAGIFEGWRRIISTVAIYDPRTGEPCEHFERLTEWSQVLEAEHADLLFDEVTGIAGAREAMGMPVAVQTILQQLRRRDVQLSWSAPSWKRADAVIRECTQLVIDCRGWLPDRSSLKTDTPPAWLPRRLFKARAFSAVDFDEWTAAKAAQGKGQVHALRAAVVQWWWGPRSMVFSAYDTLGAVTRVGEVLDGGRCAHCGGRRQVPVCRCDK